MRAVALLIMLASADVQAAELSWLGLPRAVPRSWSASRDAPAFNLMLYPRDVRTAATELAIVTLRTPVMSWRLGFAGLIELESDGRTKAFRNLFPAGNGALLWRGSYAYYAAASFDELAARTCGGCKLELGVQYRHESQHYTGSNSGDAGMDVTGEPYVGDDVIGDVAVSVTRGGWTLLARAIGFAFVPGRSSYAGGPGLDLHARWRWAGALNLFVSGYGERLFGTTLSGRRFDDAYLLRALTGIALDSDLGDVMIYASADVGNRKGIRGLTEEATVGLGVRLALGPAVRP